MGDRGTDVGSRKLEEWIAYGVVHVAGQIDESLESHVRPVVIAVTVDVRNVKLLDELPHARPREDDVGFDLVDDLEELELVARRRCSRSLRAPAR